ncbi:hypothetical protein EUBC25_13110 [Claveliimonas bilis]|uniref:DUF4367 domain-containing protein n=1 Tax=Claveliimonas bilis TaxID=3028070 RepID=UPI001E36E378|nr:DUF4367 domain-containing protein [Claveliimonas bilis]BCZ27224.1 hypothetical protein EUBC25_13110 [Claveliimonas bilis]
MKEQFDNEQFSQFLNEQLQREAEEIEKELEEHPELADLSPDDSVKDRLYAQIEEYETQKALSKLSEKDREALRLGRMLQKEREEDEIRRTVRKRRMGWRRIASLAAVMVFVLGLGITSVGGPKRVMEVMQQMVGGREMTRINSDDDEILSSGESEEEKAYQQIKDELGIDPVRLLTNEKGMQFVGIEIDEMLQTANLFFDMKGNVVSYIISLSYADGSFGSDIEDQLVDSYPYKTDRFTVEVRKYLISETDETEFSAEFDYQDVHYQLTGIMEKAELEEILKNLYFL